MKPEMIYIGIALAALLFFALLLFIYRYHKRQKKVREFIRNTPDWEKKELLNRIISRYGFAYDERSDIFYALENGWQKKYGYSRTYDELAGSMGMVIDCEPVFFTYDEQEWMIEFWKGQYGLCTGAEVGVYKRHPSRPGFYLGVPEEDYLGIGMTLCKKDKGRKDKKVFTRGGYHWWMTGFSLGTFSKPWDLSLQIVLSFPNRLMCRAFVDGLKEAGYTRDSYRVNYETVHLLFKEPKTSQPFDRRFLLDRIRLAGLHLGVKIYQHCTRHYENTVDKVLAFFQLSPWALKAFARMGRRWQHDECQKNTKRSVP